MELLEIVFLAKKKPEKASKRFLLRIRAKKNLKITSSNSPASKRSMESSVVSTFETFKSCSKVSK